MRKDINAQGCLFYLHYFFIFYFYQNAHEQSDIGILTGGTGFCLACLVTSILEMKSETVILMLL